MLAMSSRLQDDRPVPAEPQSGVELQKTNQQFRGQDGATCTAMGD